MTTEELARSRSRPISVYICALLFLLGAGHAVLCVTASDSGMYEFSVAVPGFAFDNVSYQNEIASSGVFTQTLVPGSIAIATSYLVAFITAVLAVLLCARLRPVRSWLAIIGGAITLYYAFAVYFLLSTSLDRYMTMVLLGITLWLLATITAMLPATRRAMRGNK